MAPSILTLSPMTGSDAEEVPKTAAAVLAAAAEDKSPNSASSFNPIGGFISSAPAMLALLSSRNAPIHAIEASSLSVARAPVRASVKHCAQNPLQRI